jgi:hypothetical protein
MTNCTISRSVFSVIPSYMDMGMDMDINSARNMVPVSSHVVYIGARDCLIHCHVSCTMVVVGLLDNWFHCSHKLKYGIG